MRRLTRLVLACCLLGAAVAAVAPLASAEPIAQRCLENDHFGWATQGECVTSQLPSLICSRHEESLPYPYEMEVIVRPKGSQDEVSLGPFSVEKYGDCVGIVARHWVEWVAILAGYPT